MSRSTFQQVSFISKLGVLWIALLLLTFAERSLLGAKSYYFLYIGLGLVFVMYGLTIRSIFFFLQHTRREQVYVWIAFLLWSVFICSVLAVFAVEYDLLPHTSEPSITHGRPLIDYLYYEIITTRAASRYLHGSSWRHPRCAFCGPRSSGYDPTPTCQKSRMTENSGLKSRFEGASRSILQGDQKI